MKNQAPIVDLGRLQNFSAKRRKVQPRMLAFPTMCRKTIVRPAFFLALVAFVSCETANYVPMVTPQMTATSRGKRGPDLSTLETGRTLFVRRCIECHTLPPIWKYSHEDWPKVVDDMAHRASLKPRERDAVVAYILAARASDHRVH